MKTSPKNLKRSIYQKYQRRERNLVHAVDQCIGLINDRLTAGGNIHDRAKLEALLEALNTVVALLPDIGIVPLHENVVRPLNKTFGIE